MSALSRDPLAEPPLRRKAEPVVRLWPDRHEVTAPPVQAGRPVRSGELPGGVWPTDLPEQAWPPAPDPHPSREPFLPPEGWVRDGDLLVPPPPKGILPVPPGLGPEQTPPVGTEWRNLSYQKIDARTGQSRVGVDGYGLFRIEGRANAPETLAGPEAFAGAERAMAPGAPAPLAPHHDPSPSRLAYRLHRLWLTPLIRNFVRLGLPMLLVAAFAGGWVSKPANREMVSGWVNGLVDQVQNQPMFQVASIEVIARSPEVAAGVEQVLGLSFPVSSWDLDLAELRARAEALDAVEGAWLQIRSGGVLEVRISERVPAMIWRNAEGLDLVDAQGHRVARLATRAARADLPLIAGDGAPEAIAEAEALWAASATLQPRIRGLVRVGQRRWDVVLDRNQRILLPESGAVEALERVVALSEGAQQMLSRDVLSVDMRQPARPTLRLTPEAMAELIHNRTETRGAPRR